MRDPRVPIFALAFAALTGCSSTGAAPVGSTASLTSADASASLIFAAIGTYGASVPLEAGDTVTIQYDLARSAQCQVTYMGLQPWATVAYYQYNGGPVHSLVVGGNGTVETPTFAIPGGAGGDLSVWFETTNEYGCDLYDSNYGQNFHFLVAAHDEAPPSWVGNGDSLVTRDSCTDDGECDSSRASLDAGFSFDTWARERAVVTRLEFQVWQQGVTDFDNADLWKQLDVQMHWRMGGVGPYTDSYVGFDRRLGNNARYAVDLRGLDPLPSPPGNTLTDASQCPTFPTYLSADTQYLQVDMDFWFTVNGLELRPASGGTWKGTYGQYAGLYAICAPPAATTN